jgi:pantothenate kinase type III
MLLAVDVGNTNVVFAVCDGREIRARWRIATDPRRTADQYAVWLIQLMAIENIDRAAIDQIIVSSVVPRALHNLDVLAQKYFKIEPIMAGQGPDGWGFQADVDEPRSLGADRAVNIVAAHAAYPGDLIIMRAPTRAGSLLRASISALRRWFRLPPSCRVSRSTSLPATRSWGETPKTRCRSGCTGAMSR